MFNNSVKQKIHQIQRITRMNGKTKYRGWIGVKNEVILQPGWIIDASEFHEP